MSILRDAAEDQSCIRCGSRDGTVIGAHYTGARRLAYRGGLGIKVHDLAMAHLCAQCHAWMDQFLRIEHDDIDRATLKWLHSEEFLHVIMLTILRLYDQGILLVKGERR